MDRAFSPPKWSLRPFLAIATILYLIFLVPNNARATITGSLKLADANWQEKTLYQTGDTVYIQVIDGDENKDSMAKDTLSVSVVSNTETEAETVILTEPNIATGIFQGSIELDEQENAVADGKLQVSLRDNITVTYQDLTDDWGNPITISKTASYQAAPVTISTDTT